MLYEMSVVENLHLRIVSFEDRKNVVFNKIFVLPYESFNARGCFG